MSFRFIHDLLGNGTPFNPATQYRTSASRTRDAVDNILATLGERVDALPPSSSSQSIPPMVITDDANTTSNPSTITSSTTTTTSPANTRQSRQRLIAYQNFDFGIPHCTGFSSLTFETNTWPVGVKEAWTHGVLSGSPQSAVWTFELTKQCLQMECLLLTKAFRITRAVLRKQTVNGIPFHTQHVPMPEWIFKQFLWNRLSEGERKSSPDTHDTVLFRAEVSTLKSLAMLFGTQSLGRLLSSGHRVLVGARSRVCLDWFSGAPSHPHAPEFPLLSVTRGMFVIPIMNYPSKDFVLCYKPDDQTRCKLLGLDIRGCLGIVPDAVLSLDLNVELVFSTTQSVLTINFPTWLWNPSGLPVVPFWNSEEFIHV